jgi:hypothetical protein
MSRVTAVEEFQDPYLQLDTKCFRIRMVFVSRQYRVLIGGVDSALVERLSQPSRMHM